VYDCLPRKAKMANTIRRTPLPHRGFFPHSKRMEVHFIPEQEAQLAQKATQAGTVPERLVKDAVLRLLEEDTGLHGLPQATRPNPELPVWHLGGVGALHRRDIYDDVG
jgi:hypothetical protein